ncbi:hypothetical protein GC105_16085 [Alkalibaculum sp. M08DMB]|uniref:Transposase IS200-like domain-containing protein n=2 Tax=Alkalibaculum sporogenes TaxID=2655001 RepID=A0A6A7KD87_9FIRM|nr:hypothetical protein [Alkalibaculum sporogenes]
MHSKRKNIRLQNYDYSQNGAYFITLCTKDKQHLLGRIKETHKNPQIILNNIGKLVAEEINDLSNIYDTVSVDNFVIMPNHIHIIIIIEDHHTGRTQFIPTKNTPNVPNGSSGELSSPTQEPSTPNGGSGELSSPTQELSTPNSGSGELSSPITTNPPTIPRIIKQFKGSITKKLHTSIWQKSYYDHIIRDERDYQIRNKYINENPAKWLFDEYY